MLKFFDADGFESGISNLTPEEIMIAREYVCSDFDFGEFEVAFAYFSGALIIRYYSEDAGYHFEAPIALSDSADIASAYCEITEYCKRQRIPEIIIGISPKERELMLRGAEHYNLGEDEDGSLVIEIVTECMLSDELPEYLSDDVYLGEFANAYADDYEKLIKNVNLNRYFGYNLTDDLPNGKGIDFIEFVRNEFQNNESMTFAATILSDLLENIFVGEGTLFDFDGRGNASVSFRVLPEYQRRGIGKKIFLGLAGIANSIGVHTLFGEVMKGNAPSLALLRRFADSEYEEEEKYGFVFKVESILKIN